MFKNKKINYKDFILPIFCTMLFATLFFGNDIAIAATSGNSFTSPLTTTSVEDLLTNIMTALTNIIASIAVLMIIIGGVMYMTSAGDQGRVELAKKTVTYAVIGLALTVAAPSILGEIYTALGSSTPSAASGGQTFFQIINSVISTLVGIIGSLSVLMLIIAGIMYMTSGGDDSRAETAKNTIKYAIIGLVVSILSYLIVKFVDGMF